ncbi:translation initiation factor eIF5A [Durotheca rogersii]|uniref:translation initiation factor eIF5A n=1 Tax=Durotheca rogersii TaxID=419775 RepID=UPI00221E8FC8|nr:translation initiation factor eIF5A [Durotheca rogersii]KAI5861894.1 translation initiation factor eIF5A [Durotheca rogersii]
MADEFEVDNQGDAGASKTFPMQCSALRKNGHVVIKGRPCKIVDMSTSKTGKHGHAKVHLVGIDIFTGKKLEDLCPSTHNMDVPVVSRVQYTLSHVTGDGFLVLYDEESREKGDIKNPEGELGEKLLAAEDSGAQYHNAVVTVLAAMGEEAAVKADEISQKD